MEAGFVEALRARRFSIADDDGAFQISGIIKKLDCNQLARKEANVEIDVAVTHMASGKQAFSRTYTASNVEGSVITLSAGVLGSVEDLRALTEKTLREVIDKAIDDTAFRNALKQ